MIYSKGVFKIWIIKRVRRYMEIILTFYLKKISFEVNGSFWAQKWLVLITLDSMVFLKNFAQWKESGGIWNIMVFLKRFPFGQIDHFGLKMACCHNTGSTLRIYFEILKKYMKISLMFFFPKKNHFGQMGHFGSKNGLTS